MTYSILLISHISGGSIALLSGGFAAISHKGSVVHIITGKVFVHSMMITAISAIIMSLIKPTPFLFSIGLFSFYLTFSGWIWAWRTMQARRMKWVRITGFLGLTAAFFLFYRSFSGDGTPIISLVFGSIQLVFSLLDFRKTNDMNTNIPRHGGRIGGAYISAITAFLVVNINFLPPVITWLSPTLIGTILISFAIRKWIINHSKPKV